VLEAINGLLDKLGYVRVDESWGTADMPASLLVPDEEADGEADGGAGQGSADQGGPLPGAEVLADRLAAGLAQLDAGMAARWGAQMGEAFTVVIREPHAAPWVVTVDLAAREASAGAPADSPPADNALADGLPADSAGAEDAAQDGDGEAEADWSIVGTAEAWLRLLDGGLNMSAALRRNDLRYCDYGENDFFVSEARISLLAALLGMPSLSDAAAFASGRVPALAD
jgi:hypothetical protein